MVTLKVWESVRKEVSWAITTGRMLLLMMTSSVVKDSVTVLRGGVAREEERTRGDKVTISNELLISLLLAVLARIFTGGGMEAVSKRGVCWRAELGVGKMEEVSRILVDLLMAIMGWKEEVSSIRGGLVRAVVDAISGDNVLVLVTVTKRVLFWLSSTLKV